MADMADMAEVAKPTVAVIGAGWAGCAAAVELTRRGAKVTLYEAARVAGGRARRIGYQGHVLDNGQHILLGAYRDTLRMMRTVGLRPAELLLRLPLQMRYPSHSEGMDMVAPRLPAPLHLLAGVLRATGLSVADKLSLARFSSAARWMGWQLNVDCTVLELLERFGQTERLTKLMWRPLCIAALNTPPERASAKVFLAVLRDSLGAGRAASDMLLPRVDLSALFPDAALAWVQKHGGRVLTGSRVNVLNADGDDWIVDTGNQTFRHTQVVIATAADNARGLLTNIDPSISAALAFDVEPITTCYLQYDAQLRLPSVMLALVDDPDQHRWGQFVFDRGQLDAAQSGLLAVVISASGTAIDSGTLEKSLAAQLAEALRMPALASPLWSKAITEKRATFACVPNLVRPPNTTAHRGLWLAGDYTEGEYPATIEGAVRSGLEAARGVLGLAV
jgi:squalene-associated FAD-dependent desaturase